MKVVCAWCGKEIGKYDDNTDEVSHGICDDCLRKVEKENGISDGPDFNKT